MNLPSVTGHINLTVICAKILSQFIPIYSSEIHWRRIVSSLIENSSNNDDKFILYFIFLIILKQIHILKQ